MSHRTRFPPPSPALSPSLYSGMSSLQINQAGPGPVAGSSYHPSTSQHQKALLKGPKAMRYQNRRSEHPCVSTPWKDPRQAVAASSGHKRTVKDDVSFKRTQAIWTPFPPEARPTTDKERDIMLRAAADHILEQNAQAERMYNETYGNAEQRVAALEAAAAERMRMDRFNESVRRDRERYLLRCIEKAPSERFRQYSQECLDRYYEEQRKETAPRAVRDTLAGYPT